MSEVDLHDIWEWVSGLTVGLLIGAGIGWSLAYAIAPFLRYKPPKD